MLAYILGIKGITNLGRFYGLQIGGKILQIGTGVLNWGKEISNRGRRD